MPASLSVGGSGGGAPGAPGANGQAGGRRPEERGAGAGAGQPAARGLKGNWEALWAAVARDHCHAGLIWNETTRAELREALQARFSAAGHTCALLHIEGHLFPQNLCRQALPG